MSSLQKIHDPKYFGPGWWLAKKILAREVRKKEHLKRSFAITVTIADTHLTCAGCQTNAIEHLNANPPTKIGDPMEWVVAFQNHASKKTGKREWTVEEALSRIDIDITNVAYSGPGLWIFIHTIALYANTYIEKFAVLEMLDVLFTVLYVTNSNIYKGIEFYLEPKNNNRLRLLARPNSKENFNGWMVEMHNYVNSLKGSSSLTVEEVVAEYEKGCSGEGVEGCK